MKAKLKQRAAPLQRIDVPQAGFVYGAKGGFVYGAKGGATRTKYFIIIAVTGKVAHCIGIDEFGQIVSTASYGAHVFERRKLLGQATNISSINIEIDWIDE